MPHENNVCSKYLRGTFQLRHQPLGEIIAIYPAIYDRVSVTRKFKVCILHVDKTVQYLNGSVMKFPKVAVELPQTRITDKFIGFELK
jgi:hypothetical protein